MKASYAVTWCNGSREPVTGRLELDPEAVRLEGRSGDDVVREVIPYRELASVSVGRDRDDRIEGRNTLVLERRGQRPLRIAGVGQPWIVSELAERLARLHVARTGSSHRLAVIVPIRESARETARELLRLGAPFDPSEAGLERHTVLLGEREAVFLFESMERESIERLFRDPQLWTAAHAWRDIVSGPACLAELVFDWNRGGAGELRPDPSPV